MTPSQARTVAPAPPSADDPRVVRALEEYIAAMEAGSPPPRDEFLARHADVAGVLADCLFGLEMVHHAGRGRPAGGPAPSANGDGLAEMEPLGDFQIVREVGRGGMGVVYEAVQRSLGRRVALKVLPFAATMDPRQLQRFHNEARAAAGLHHTNIVPVYAVGVERGVHYYAMQFIEGQTLADLIAEQRGEALSQVPTMAEAEAAASATTVPPGAQATSAAPRDRAYFRRVAEWGIQAAEALDCAHSLGVVHRDVKPANLMVDTAGRLWVTDFGLAQVQSDARLTMTGDLVGTLRYMSPEQALAKRVVIDHRTDVYALGATLYELLALRPAFGGADRQELLRQIAFEEPLLPRRVNKAIPAELETIVLKAMEKGPTERYATAQELADDLRHWLEDRPIRARRPSLGQRARKWARRHRPLVVAAALLLLFMILIGGAVGLSWVRTRAAAEGEARVLLQQARRLGQEEKWDEALSAARHAQALLTVAGADPRLHQEAEELVKDLPTVARLGEIRLEAINSTDSTGTLNFAAEDRAYARAFADYGLDLAALDAEAVADRIRASGIRVPLLEALDDWAYVRDMLRDGDGEPLRAVARLADEDPWRQQLRDPQVRHDRAALERLAQQEDALTQPPAVLRWLAFLLHEVGAREAQVRLMRAAQQRRPGEYYNNTLLAQSLAEDPAALADAIGFQRAAVALRPQNPWAHYNLGVYLAVNGRPDEAIAEYREAIRLKNDHVQARNNLNALLVRKGQLALDPTDAQAHLNLANGLTAMGDLDGAIKEVREALRLQKDSALAHYNLGTLLHGQGQLDEAVAELREAIRLKKDYPEANCNLGHAFRDKGQFAEALTYLRRGHELGSKYPRWAYPSAQWVKQCERLVEIDAKLNRVLKGEVQPADVGERLALAHFCQLPCKSLRAAAARFYAGAFAEQPRLADDLQGQARYSAACAAALAGCGQGKDADQSDDKERARLRRQALEWLRADLAAYRRLLEKEPDKAAPLVRQRMQHWQQDSDFAGVRGADALGKLPEAERADWQKLWADAVDTLTRANGKAAAEKKSDTK